MSIQIIQKPRGTLDYINNQGKLLENLRESFLNETKKYNCEYIEVPMFEENKLFHRTVGESSDIVRKETFDLEQKGDKNYTLRPEFTASVARAIIENKIYTLPDMPLKYCYFGPVFRYERPQTGRYRQITQMGVEFFDIKLDLHTVIDALLLSINSAKKFLKHNIKVKLNYLGSFESREKYKDILKEYFKDKIDSMCDDCKQRFETNPLRILDCKVENDQEIARNAPKIGQYLNNDDQKEFNDILKCLKKLNIDYIIDDGLVRGLDYYTGLVWELYDENNYSLGAIGGGGKYSSLVSSIGGPLMEGVGFSLGGERLLMSLSENEKNSILDKDELDYFIIDFKRDNHVCEIANKLRENNKSVFICSYSRALGGAFKMADKKHAKNVIILENDGTIKLKDMQSRQQVEISEAELLNIK